MKKLLNSVILASICLAVVLGISTAARAITPTGQAQLEADWLMQCAGKPTTKLIGNEIGWARDVAARLTKLKGCPSMKAPLATLAQLEKKVAGAKSADAVKALYLQVRTTKRSIMFSNPLINFDKVVLIDNPFPMGRGGDATNEWKHEARHRNGYMGVSGGKLLAVDLEPGGETTNLFGDHEGSFWRPDVHFSGEKVVSAADYNRYMEIDSSGKEIEIFANGDYAVTKDYDTWTLYRDETPLCSGVWVTSHMDGSYKYKFYNESFNKYVVRRVVPNGDYEDEVEGHEEHRAEQGDYNVV